MTRLYKIVDWDKHFEIAQSKRPSKLSWVPIPNKHDGSGYKRISRLKNPCEIFAAWVLIVQVASKCPERGVLKKNGIPLNAEDLSICTDFPISIFERALSELSSSKIGWLSYEDIPEQENAHTAIIPKSEHDMSTVDYRTVQDKTVQYKTDKQPLTPKGEDVSDEPKRPKRNNSSVCDSEWIEQLENDPTYKGINVKEQLGKMKNWCNVNNKQPSRKRFINWLNRTDRPISKVEDDMDDWNAPTPEQLELMIRDGL